MEHLPSPDPISLAPASTPFRAQEPAPLLPPPTSHLKRQTANVRRRGGSRDRETRVHMWVKSGCCHTPLILQATSAGPMLGEEARALWESSFPQEGTGSLVDTDTAAGGRGQGLALPPGPARLSSLLQQRWGAPPHSTASPQLGSGQLQSPVQETGSQLLDRSWRQHFLPTPRPNFLQTKGQKRLLG